MCQLCAQTQTFDPTRHWGTGDALDFAHYTETTDAAASTATRYELGDGDSFTGDLSRAGDQDWIRVSLSAGNTYEIALTATTDGGGLLDPYLWLYNSNGRLMSWNDDGGPGLNAALNYTASSAGTYYIAAASFQDRFTGTYNLSFTSMETPDPEAPGTLDALADFLVSGYWDGNRHAFDTSDSTAITVNIDALTASGQQLARWAFEAWEMVADIEFVEVSRDADINFDDEDSGAYASYVGSGGVTTSADINVSKTWLRDYGTSISSYSFNTYIHEIGHALGLGHQGPYNGSATYGRDQAFSNDSYQMSVMSYFGQDENTTVEADYAEPITAMMADIVAIQELYGAPGSDSQTAGNTVWGAGTTLTGYLAEVFASLGGSPRGTVGSGPISLTLYDRDGVDLIDLSTVSTSNRLNLNDTTASDIAGLTGNLLIARGTMIENATMGRGHDTVRGNESDNLLSGQQGRDRLFGEAGEDRLFGGSGADRLFGGNDADRLFGGGGRDRLFGGADNDRLFGKNADDQLEGGSGDDLLVGGGGADSFVFTRGCDRDRIRDFQLGSDRLLLDTELTDGLSTGQEVWDRFGQALDDKLLLKFGNGDVIKLLGLSDSEALVDDILFL